MTNTHVLVLDRSSSQYARRLGTSWKPADDFTIFWRHKPDSIPTGVDKHYVISKTGSSGIEIFSVWMEASGEIHASIKRSDGGQSAVHWTTYEALAGVWATCAITCDISEATATERELYVDGISYGNGVVDASSNVTSLAGGSGNLGVGVYMTGANGFWDGKLDELAIHNGVLSQATIAGMQNEETDPTLTSVNGIWLFNNDLTDSDGGEDLTGINAPTFDAEDLPDFTVAPVRAIAASPSPGGIGFSV